MSKKMDCIIISGFLGSGKTTFVNQLLQQIDSQKNVAIAINDFGKINLDLSLVNFPKERIISLKKGCMCCSLAAKFIIDFDKLYKAQPTVDTFIIEASGITSLESLIHIIKSDHMNPKLNLTNVITTVNASNFIRIQNKLAIIKQQVVMADTIILNYKDQTLPDLFEDTKTLISKLNEQATIFETSFSKIPVNILAQQSSLLPTQYSENSHNSDEMFTGEIMLDGISDINSLVSILTSLPENIYRAKGIIQTKKGLQLIEKVDNQITSVPYIAKQDKTNINTIVLIGWEPFDNVINNAIILLKNAEFVSSANGNVDRYSTID